MIEIFTQMTTKGPDGQTLTIPSKIQQRAFTAWSQPKSGLRYAGLGSLINHEMGGIWTEPHPFARAADRMVQKLRKSGAIARDGRLWTLTDEGAELRNSLIAEHSTT
jgi:hypothetical protein